MLSVQDFRFKAIMTKTIIRYVSLKVLQFFFFIKCEFVLLFRIHWTHLLKLWKEKVSVDSTRRRLLLWSIWILISIVGDLRLEYLVSQLQMVKIGIWLNYTRLLNVCRCLLLLLRGFEKSSNKERTKAIFNGSIYDRWIGSGNCCCICYSPYLDG